MGKENNPVKQVFPYDDEDYQKRKRFLDIVTGSLGSLVVCIVYLILWPFYQFGNNRGPIIYKQKRVGQYGKEFYVYKFRSMVVNAEDVLKKNPILYRQYVRNSYKLNFNDDPRITKLGKFIRRTSIDELPQFINVLKGDMSIVGPRPILNDELKSYGNKKKEFLMMKPGMTGLWQSSGRSNIEYPERCDVELSYLSNDSIKKDIKIILKTIKKVLIHEGAY